MTVSSYYSWSKVVDYYIMMSCNFGQHFVYKRQHKLKYLKDYVSFLRFFFGPVHLHFGQRWFVSVEFVLCHVSLKTCTFNRWFIFNLLLTLGWINDFIVLLTSAINLQNSNVLFLTLFANAICELGAGVVKFIISRAVVCISCLRMYACKYIQNVPANCKASLTSWVIYSVYLQHLHSWCLQRSTQTKGGEQWCFLQASEEQPTETPWEVTTWSPSEVCSRSRWIARLLNLTSRKQPGTEREEEEEYEKKLYNARRCTKTPVLRQNLLWTHLCHGRGGYSRRETYELTHTNGVTCRPMHMQAPLHPIHK